MIYIRSNAKRHLTSQVLHPKKCLAESVDLRMPAGIYSPNPASSYARVRVVQDVK